MADCSALTSLDLTGSLLSGWASVLEITECLQALREIILEYVSRRAIGIEQADHYSQSLLDFTINPIDSFPSSLQSLQLRACSLQPTDVRILTTGIPSTM